MNNINLFIKFLKEERKRQNLTQVQLAKKANINEKYYGGIERGESIPTLEKVIELCNALGVKIHLDKNNIN